MSDDNAREVRRLYSSRLWTSIAFAAVMITYGMVGYQLDTWDGLVTGLMAASVLLAVLLLYVRTRDRHAIKIALDQTAQDFVREAGLKHMGVIRILAQKFGNKDYDKTVRDARRKHSIQEDEGDFIFIEVAPRHGTGGDTLQIHGHLEGEGKYKVLRCSSVAVADAIATLLIHVRDLEAKVPHIYLSWSEEHPLSYALKYVIFGEGGTAPLIRERLRKQEPELQRRPIVHVA